MYGIAITPNFPTSSVAFATASAYNLYNKYKILGRAYRQMRSRPRSFYEIDTLTASSNALESLPPHHYHGQQLRDRRFFPLQLLIEGLSKC